ncbi:MAG TPA: hypothetical protein VHV55_19440 [Pirellulales bacterium]|nr:hypothetical protein [Pirellulales bacterium]
MNESEGVWGVSLAELEAAMRRVDPQALLVPGRILRRVIKQDRQVAGPGLRVPHRKTYVVARDRLLKIVDLSELNLSPEARLPDRLILIGRPEVEVLATMVRARALQKYWRLLFHARVHAALDDRAAAGHLDAAAVRRRIERLGTIPFHEARSVLRGEDLLLPPVDETSAYVEFAAVYLELRWFAPSLLPDYFPSLEQGRAVDELLAEDLDAAAIFAETRLPGAQEPDEDEAADEETWQGFRLGDESVHPQKQSERRHCRLMERGDRARSRGNHVRSAMVRWQAALVIGPKLARSARSEARHDIERLTQRLEATLGMPPDARTSAWADALSALLPPAIRGIWTAEARLLYDLQKVCVDYERGVYALDLLGWLKSWGRRPLKRPVPCQREVLMIKHLHAAERRLKSVRISPSARRQLASLLETAEQRTQARMAEVLRPRLVATLEEVGLVPRNLPERVAQRKVVEELLDQITNRGYLAMGDLRDTISRNNLKLRDFPGFSSLLSGDQLLEADRRLANALAGVYRRGEIYLRLPQSLSSLAFGTPVGRFLTRYAILPFGVPFIVLYALEHLIDLAAKRLGTNPVELCTTGSVLLLGLFTLGLLYHPAFRDACRAGILNLYRVARWLVVDLPAMALRLPWIRRFVESAAFRLLHRYGLKPLILSALLIAVLSLVARHNITLRTDAIIFVSMNLLLNSRLGRDVDELVTDWAVRGWHHLRMRVFANLFRWIADSFHQFLEGVERFLYSVDEWLRFRSGESRPTVISKAVLGVLWAMISYVVRLCVNLLVEPQINPIKHFPVVTVSHKILLPTIEKMGEFMTAQLGPLVGTVAAFATVFGLPGVFGFLVWELKENWRLYGANRPRNLQPVMVGYKGETMIRLLRPGFHSGTLSKVFAKLRRADRKAQITAKWTRVRKQRDHLERVRLEVKHLIEREFITLIELSPRWHGGQLAVGQVRLGVHSIRIEILGSIPEQESLWLEFCDLSGWLLAGIERVGWLAALEPGDMQLVSQALAGLYKMSGVDLVREQIQSQIGADTHFDLCEAGLVLWPAGDSSRRVVYSLRDPDPLVPHAIEPGSIAFGPVLQQQKILFGKNEISWSRWLETWSLADAPADLPSAATADILIGPALGAPVDVESQSPGAALEPGAQ